MLDIIKTLLTHQYEAALCNLNACIDQCPNDRWQSLVRELTFDQVVLHTLFYADLYLGRDEASFRAQPFHRDNPDFFRDYEELQDRKPELHYDRAPIRRYLQHCRAKAAAMIATETAETLSAPCGLPRRNFSRAELYIYNLRHIQHHAAQLTLRLRLDINANIPWFGSGWRDA